jgi:hypothetical protein
MQAEALLSDMAFERKIAEQKVRGREETINEHLVKLLAFDAGEALRASWRKELARKHLVFLAALRLKPGRRPLPRRDWYAWLYADPFEGNEEGYARALIGLHANEYPRNSRSPADIAAAIDGFHTALAQRLAAGDPGLDLIERL